MMNRFQKISQKTLGVRLRGSAQSVILVKGKTMDGSAKTEAMDHPQHLAIAEMQIVCGNMLRPLRTRPIFNGRIQNKQKNMREINV